MCAFTLLHFLIFFLSCSFAQNNRHTIYLIPGIGADGRMFQNLKLDCDTVILEFLLPEKNELLPAYAKRMAAKIDTTETFSLLGHSFGGMIAVEISKFTHPQKVFVVSGAKRREELPAHYRLMKYIPLHKLFGGKSLNRLANFARQIWEPESRQQTATFKKMTNDTPPKMIQRSVHCIVNWENESCGENIIHLHGEKDNTLPVRKIKNPVIIKNASHEMTLLHSEEISAIVNTELRGK